jgi:hypothetical protein
MLKLKSISPSRIKTFDTCKYKYWLTYHCPDIVLRSNWGAEHGSLVHDVLENYSNGNDLDPIGRLYRGYGGTLETLDRYQQPEIMKSPLVWAKPKDYNDKEPHCDTCPYVKAEEGVCGISREPLDNLPGCPRDLFDGSISMVERAINRYKERWPKTLKDKKGVPIGCEYGFRINIPGTNVPMIGYMDLVIEENPETIHVIDYKTGSWTQDYQECRDDIQVKMYSLASRREFIDDISNKGYNYKNVILTFDYFTKNPITVAFTEEEDLETEKFVLDKINEIESTQWINRIVRNNEELETKTRFGQVAFTCKYLCDSNVCKENWQGKFEVE